MIPLLRLADRRGVALPLALFTLVIAAVMITAVFYVGRLEQRMGNNSVAATQAFEAAETGVARVMNSWPTTSYSTLPNGAAVALPLANVGPNATYTAIVRRLNANLYMIQAEGRYVVNGAAVTRRQVARLVRLDPVVIRTAGVVTALKRIEVLGSTTISGRDTVPTAWAAICPPPSVYIPGVGDSSGSLNTSGPCGGNACIDGNPDHLIDPVLVNSDLFNVFGGADWATLVGGAQITVGSGSLSPGPTYTAATPPACLTSDPNNWGEPLDPTSSCGDYLPVVHAPGDLNLTGGRGQGILLVDGDFTMAPGAVYYGLIIVHGTVNMTGGTIVGGLMVWNPAEATALISGTKLNWSECVVNRVRDGLGLPSPMSERGWVQLY